MNRAYFLTNLLARLEQAIFPRGRAAPRKQLVIHLDNCPVHTSRASRDWSEEHDMRRMPQPSYSPNLAPSDFCLFRPFKEKLERTQVAGDDQFFGSFPAISRGICQKDLNRVFQAWVRRVQEVSKGNRDYVG
jgi:hypothetical protein